MPEKEGFPTFSAMKVRVELAGVSHQDKNRFLEIKFLPRVGEFVETDFCGPCEVLQVVHTPNSADQDAVLTLGKG